MLLLYLGHTRSRTSSSDFRSTITRDGVRSMDALFALPDVPSHDSYETFAIGLVRHNDGSVSLSVRTQSQVAEGNIVIEDVTAAFGLTRFGSLDEALDFIHDSVLGNKTRQEAEWLHALCLE